MTANTGVVAVVVVAAVPAAFGLADADTDIVINDTDELAELTTTFLSYKAFHGFK